MVAIDVDAPTLLVAARLARLFDVVGSDDGDRLAVLPVALPFAVQHVPGTAAWKALPLGEQAAAEAALSVLVNGIADRRSVWLPHPDAVVWDVQKLVLEDAELGVGQLSRAEERALEDAEAVVRNEAAPDGISDKFRAYEHHQQIVLDLRGQLGEAETAGKDTSLLRAELDAAETAWKVAGHKFEIEVALATIARTFKARPVVEWERASGALVPERFLTSNDFGPYLPTTVTPSLLDEVQWQALEILSDDIQPLIDEGRARFADLIPDEEDVDLNGLTAIRFEAIVIRFIRRSWLRLDLIESAAWRWPDDRPPVADGAGTGLMPSIANGAVMVRKIVIERREKSGSVPPRLGKFGPLLLSMTQVTAPGPGGTVQAGVQMSPSDLRAIAFAAALAKPKATQPLSPNAAALVKLNVVPAALEANTGAAPSSAAAGATRLAAEATARRSASALTSTPPATFTVTRPSGKQHLSTFVNAAKFKVVTIFTPLVIRLAGKVVNARDGQPVAGAALLLQDASDKIVAQTKSGSDGSFEFKVSKETYVITVIADGFIATSIPDLSASDPAMSVLLDPDHRDHVESWQLAAFIRHDLAPSPDPDPDLSFT